MSSRVNLAIVVIAALALMAVPSIARAEAADEPASGPSDDEAECGKPYEGPLTPRPNTAEQPDFAWNAGYVEQEVTMVSARTCATLAGVLYGPADLLGRRRLPAVLVLPPSGGVATGENVAYIARALAVTGYVALTVDPPRGRRIRPGCVAPV